MSALAGVLAAVAAGLAVALMPPVPGRRLPLGEPAPVRRAASGARDGGPPHRSETVLRALAAELEAGAAPGAAARSVAVDLPATAGMRLALEAAAAADVVGGDASAALAGCPELAELAAAWAVCQRSGASLAGPVRRLADVAARRTAAEREIEAALAGPRTTARLLAILPAGGLLLGQASGANPLQVLLGTPAGWACLVVGVALDVAGVLWLRRLAASALRPEPGPARRRSGGDQL